MAQNPSPSLRALSLDGDLDVFSIHQQWEKVCVVLTLKNEWFELDLSSVKDLDLSGIQLLYALDRDLRSKGIAHQLTGAQEAWNDRFTPAGMAHLFSGGFA